MSGTTTISLEEHMARSRTATPEQIRQNIEAGRIRAEALRAKNREMAEQARLARLPPPNPYADLIGKRVGFVVRNKHGLYIAFAGRPIDDETDAFISVEGKQGPFELLTEAAACLDDEQAGFAKVFPNPVAAGGMMGTWLSELHSANPRA